MCTRKLTAPLHGKGDVTPSAYLPYVRSNTGPAGTETDMLSNLHETKHSSPYTRYVRTGEDRDNSDDVLENIERFFHDTGSDRIATTK